jgi:L-alanine-DL-glutamate epimerase-like enolase superfamily enzyme
MTERPALGPVRITRIEAAPLFGESPKGGWSAEIKPEDSIHALIAVHTDAGVTGYGSVFTDGRLVQAGLQVLEPLYRDENALEPERVSEKLHQ